MLILNELLSKAPLGSPGGQVEDDGVKPPPTKAKTEAGRAVRKNESPPKVDLGCKRGLRMIRYTALEK